MAPPFVQQLGGDEARLTKDSLGETKYPKIAP